MIELYFSFKVIGSIIFVIVCIIAIIYALAKNWEIFRMIRDIGKPESHWRKKCDGSGEEQIM